MRTVALILTTLGLMALGSAIPAVATAQEQNSSAAPRDGRGYRGLTADDLNAYCLWNGRLYSLGASFCYRADSSTTCIERPGKRPGWANTSNDKLCEKNPSTMPQ